MPSSKKKPIRLRVAGEMFVATVLRVVEKDELGRPLLLSVLRPGETAVLSQEDPTANQFIVCYTKEGSV